MYLLDTYVPKLYRGSTIEEAWKKVKEKAGEIDWKNCSSLSSDIIDYLFVGSTAQFQKI